MPKSSASASQIAPAQPAQPKRNQRDRHLAPGLRPLSRQARTTTKPESQKRLEKALRRAAVPRAKGWRKVTQMDRRFLEEFEKLGFSKPEQAAALAGFKTPGAGYKLEHRLRDLIDAQRVRARIVSQMDLDEALMLTAEGARDAADRKTQATFLQMILRVHGALSDKPLPQESRRDLARQVASIVDRMQKIAQSAGGRVKLRAALGVELDVTSGASTSPSSSPDDPPIDAPAAPHPDPAQSD